MSLVLGYRFALALLVLALTSVISAVLASDPGGATGRWVLMEKAVGSGSCVARLSGKEIDTVLMLNQSGELILVAGRADWNGSGSQEIGLRIDGFEVEYLAASAFNNLVLLPIDDETVLKRLKASKDIYWLLSSGTYHATVAGLGDALSWVQQRDRAKRLNVGGARPAS